MRRSWGLGPLAALLVMACVGPAPAWAAPPPVDVQTVRVGFASTDKANQFKVGAWTPVWVQLGAGANGFTGVLEVVVADDAGTPAAFHQPVQLGPKETQRFVSYARPGERNPEFTVRALDRNGRRASNDYNTASAGMQLNAVQPDGTLLVTLGRPVGVEMIPGLPDFNVQQSQGMSETAVGGVDTLGGTVPGRWYGYDAATAVVLDTGDRETMRSLDSFRGKPLADWVARGGHLVVAVGRDWQAVTQGFLGPLLPAEPAGQVKVNSLEALDAYAGSGANKQTKQITPPGSPAVMITKLQNVARGAKVLASTGDLPLVVRGSYGFGRVTLLAFDVDQKPFSTWEDRAGFWVRALDLHRQGADLSANNPRVIGGRMYQSGVSDLAGALRKALEQFPGVRLVPFGWVAFFIFLYILLIGPGDYLFLKKVVKRMELTWVTFPLIVVTVSLLAYYAAYVVKGNELRVNKVDIVDVDQASGVLRGSSWLNVFSPQNRDYDVSVLPERLDVAAPAADPNVPARPAAGTDVVLSWFAAPEVGFGGMGGQGRMNFSSGGYAYAPVSSAEALEGVRIPIWSTKCFTARWFAPTANLIDADLKPVGVDRIEGTLTNGTGAALRDVILVHGNQVYSLATIAPGATVRINPTETRFLSGRLNDISRRYASLNNYQPNTTIDRADLAFDLMFHDSRSATSGEATLTSNPLHYVDLSGQLALGRPMLVARVERAASRLVLGNAPSPPKVDEVTMLRVILPLK
ncbi:MAG: hypothetical protein P4L84_30255 [Isosphaeraceae bacterium]|nr:hypothetical protein [Isosphaeraceae bacterium]